MQRDMKAHTSQHIIAQHGTARHGTARRACWDHQVFHMCCRCTAILAKQAWLALHMVVGKLETETEVRVTCLWAADHVAAVTSANAMQCTPLVELWLAYRV
jgi:hypothetical protein